MQYDRISKKHDKGGCKNSSPETAMTGMQGGWEGGRKWEGDGRKGEVEERKKGEGEKKTCLSEN